MNSKKAGVAIIFALLATQLVLTYKVQTDGEEFRKQIEANKAEIRSETDKRIAAEKKASEAKTKVDDLTKENSKLTRELSTLKSRLATRSLDQQKLEQEAGKLKDQLKALELASSKKEQELLSAQQELSKASKAAQDSAGQSKAREARMISQIDEVKKALEEKSQRVEAAKKALDSTKESK
jgi:chromosome segregation ATPase